MEEVIVLEKMVGKSIGKRLRRLHEDLPNFSSATDAAQDGSIKRKCGARELKNIAYYYPVSRFLTMQLELAVCKPTPDAVRLPRLRLPSVYLPINSPCHAFQGLADRDS